MTAPRYLGDGAYVHMDDSGNVVLTTGHHDPDQADNTIALGTVELDALLVWLGVQPFGPQAFSAEVPRDHTTD